MRHCQALRHEMPVAVLMASHGMGVSLRVSVIFLFEAC